MAKGARLAVEGKQLAIVFQYKDAWSVKVVLQTPHEKGRMKGRLVVIEEGKEAYNGDVDLVESKPVR